MFFHVCFTYFWEFHKARFWGCFPFTQLHSAITDLYDVLYHIYADDTQSYLSFKIGNLNQFRIKVESYNVAIKQWMSDKMLKLNNDKT